MPDTKHVIHQPRPLRRALILLISVSLACSLLWLYLSSNSHQTTTELNILKSQHKQLLQENKTLQQQFELTAKNLMTKEQSLAIQQETDKQLQRQITDLQNEIVELNRELNFYQNITQGSGSSELQIRDFYLSPDPNDSNIFNYRIVITQGKKISQPIIGTVSLMIKNKDAKTIINGKTLKHELRLRQVQVLDGQIELTPQEKPNMITVTLKRNKKKSLSKDFDWLPKPTLSR